MENFTPSFASKETISLLSKRNFEDRVHYKILATFLDNALNSTVVVERSVGEQGVLNETASNCNRVKRVEVESSLLFRIFWAVSTVISAVACPREEISFL